MRPSCLSAKHACQTRSPWPVSCYPWLEGPVSGQEAGQMPQIMIRIGALSVARPAICPELGRVSGQAGHMPQIASRIWPCRWPGQPPNRSFATNCHQNEVLSGAKPVIGHNCRAELGPVSGQASHLRQIAVGLGSCQWPSQPFCVPCREKSVARGPSQPFALGPAQRLDCNFSKYIYIYIYIFIYIRCEFVHIHAQAKVDLIVKWTW